MPTVKKLKDWSAWWDGLRSKAMRAGAESIATNLTGLIGSNGIANMGIDAFKDMGMNWKTFLLFLVVQFGIRVGLSAALYVQNKPDPDVITETIETTHTIKDSDGSTEVGTSKTVTTTPTDKP